ncbi:hypothetical protein N657DRAFT_632848 [Parathielavia appendiculata]|uniref:Uncharacterized protein n=1 Tax=Parathielavia appendiculata TaxID=2587402 RepID=A0AAN6Z444_9PEZI|nr:hypothetical protein N657DRAFT_632848 [Parathielavia appendiculata]
MAAVAIVGKYGSHHMHVFRAIKEALEYGVGRDTLEGTVKAGTYWLHLWHPTDLLSIKQALDNEEYPADLSVEAAVLATAKKLSMSGEAKTGSRVEIGRGRCPCGGGSLRGMVEQFVAKRRPEHDSKPSGKVVAVDGQAPPARGK